LRIFKKNDPSYFRAHNFLAFSLFLSIFSVTDAPGGVLHLLVGHHKQGGPPVETVSKPFLKCLDTNLLTLLNFSCLTILLVRNGLIVYLPWSHGEELCYIPDLVSSTWCDKRISLVLENEQLRVKVFYLLQFGM
jgi:hypothetical protein